MTNPKTSGYFFKILIVDKDRQSRTLLKKVLNRVHSDYEFFEATDSEETKKIISEKLPDLIMLDVMMPGNEGFDLCLLLKADGRYQDIPILIITALDNLEDKVRGFKVGASDYILKPINELETNARVEAHLRIKRFQDRQKELNSELRKTQSALLQASKLSAVGKLSAGIAHEFNNVLQIIGGCAEVCVDCDNPEDFEKMINAIQECTRRGKKIVKGLLDFSRQDEFQNKELIFLKDLLDQNLQLVKKSLMDQEIELITELEVVPPLEGYPGQLSQVFVNLVKNATEAMKGQPVRRLTVSMKSCDCQTELCAADTLKKQDRAKGCVIISIRDTGAGIDESIKDKIFEPFFTTKGVVGGGNDSTPGTGLGLSVSYGIVKRHDGFIDCESKVGEGTTFKLTLPVRP